MERFFFAQLDEQFTDDMIPLCIQDLIHTVAKLRNQLLKARSDQNILLMGQYVASGSFLHIMLEKPKAEHFLVLSDIDGNDKMNFRSVQKIVDPRVTSTLKSIPASEGTQTYLIMIRGIMNAFMDKDLKITDRVYLMWRSTFFFRYWRLWLKANKHPLASHFITLQTYHCIEINAHSLINVYRRLRESNKLELFLIWLMDSQGCEGFFRDSRSMSSAFSTVVNMDMLDFLHKTRKIERMGDVRHKLSKTLVMPRHHKKMQEVQNTAETLRTESPCSDADLIKVIHKARSDALAEAVALGMAGVEDITVTPVLLGLPSNIETDFEETIDEPCEELREDSEDVPEEVIEDIAISSAVNFSVNFDEEIPPSSIFVKRIECGKTCLVKKSRIVWELTTKNSRLSSDRKERYRAPEETLEQQNSELVSEIVIKEEVKLGDWCLFKNSPLPNHFFVGLIISFTYLSGSGKGRAYSKSFAPVSTPEEVNPRGIGCMGAWFTVSYEGEGKLKPHEEPTTFHDLKRYKSTLPRPNVVDGMLFFPPHIISAVKKLMKWHPKSIPRKEPQRQSRRHTRS